MKLTFTDRPHYEHQQPNLVQVMTETLKQQKETNKLLKLLTNAIIKPQPSTETNSIYQDRILSKITQFRKKNQPTEIQTHQNPTEIFKNIQHILSNIEPKIDINNQYQSQIITSIKSLHQHNVNTHLNYISTMQSLQQTQSLFHQHLIQQLNNINQTINQNAKLQQQSFDQKLLASNLSKIESRIDKEPVVQNMVSYISQERKVEKEDINKFQKTKEYNRIYKLHQYCDRREIKLKVNFGDLLKKLKINRIENDKLYQSIVTEWLGVTYRATASICWNMLQTHQLNFDQIKILFTQNIVFNFIELMKDIDNLNLKDFKKITPEIVNKKSIPILTYLCKQFPQTKIDAPNMTLREILPSIDEKGRIDYQLVRKSKVQFKLKKSRDYTSEIMQFINYLIDVSNREFDDFESYMNNLFSKLFFPHQMRNDLKTTLATKGEKTIIESPIAGNNAAYYEKVKKYTKYLIGRKIPKNVQKYTKQEMDNGVFFIKSSSILRVIAKWVEELKEVAENPQQLIRDWYHGFKNHNGEEYYAVYPIRKALYQTIIENRSQLLAKLQAIRKQCYQIEGQLANDIYISDSDLKHLSDQQINVGFYSANMKNALSSYLCSSLNEVIHFLLSCPNRVDPKTVGLEKYQDHKTNSQLDTINLITFRVFDLLRCKCISGQSQIIWLVNQLMNTQKKHTPNQNNRLSIVRVKDRLAMGSRDIMINAQIGNGLVFEMQLSVTNQVEEKQQLLDKYNHFLYELRRSTMLGSLIENVCIWSTLQQRASYFEQLTYKKSIKQTYKPFKHFCIRNSFKRYNNPMVCSSCNSFFHIQRMCIPSRICDKCKVKVCGECYYEGLNAEGRKKQLFDKFSIKQLMSLVQQVKECKVVPKDAFFFKKNNLKVDLCYMSSYSVEEQQKQPFRKAIQTFIKGTTITNKMLVSTPEELQKLNNYIIFEFISQKFEYYTIDDIRQLDQKNQNKIRIINLLFDPNYPEKIKQIANEKKKIKFLVELQKVVENRKIKAIKLKKLIILLHVVIQKEELQRTLIIEQNIQKLKEFAQTSSSVISMEKKNMTIQMNILKSQIGDDLYKSLCLSVSKLYINYGLIQSISSLQQFTHLTRLYIGDNQIASLKGAQRMIKLKIINFQRNIVEGIQPLRNLIKLEFINGDENKIKSLKGVEKLNNLKQLSIQSNQIQNMQSLDNLHQLQNLYLRKNKIQKVKGMANNQKLVKLSLSNNPITQFNLIKKAKALKALILCQLNLEKIPIQLQSLPLQKLALDQNLIQKIQNLDKLKDLKILSLSNNRIEKIQGLDNLKLSSLNLDNNKIKIIQGIKNFFDTLEILSIKKNPIEDCGDLLLTDIQFKIYWSKQSFSPKALQQINIIFKLESTPLVNVHKTYLFTSQSLLKPQIKQQEMLLKNSFIKLEDQKIQERNTNTNTLTIQSLDNVFANFFN